MTQIPENFTDFLYWVKEQTELFWSIDPKTSENDFICEEWIYGAKWIGMTESEIDTVEIKYRIKFTSEHRTFLKILHAIDRKEKREYTESFDEDAPILIEEYPFFYNWLQDEKEIRERFNWPFETIFQHVIDNNQVWLKSWGIRPDPESERKKIFSEWYNKAPKLIPVKDHRFVVSDDNLNYKPILSMYGSDIIVYGWNFRGYLLNELKEHLNVSTLVYDSEYDCYDPEFNEEVVKMFKEDYKYNENKTIPFWEEMILIWSSGWGSFGLKYPGENDSNVHLIVKTYSPDGNENQPLTLSGF